MDFKEEADYIGKTDTDTLIKATINALNQYKSFVAIREAALEVSEEVLTDKAKEAIDHASKIAMAGLEACTLKIAMNEGLMGQVEIADVNEIVGKSNLKTVEDILNNIDEKDNNNTDDSGS